MKFARKGSLAVDPHALEDDYAYDSAPSIKVPVINGVAIVEIRGPMAHHAEWYWDSYDEILKRADVAFRLGDSVLFMGDTPGGEVSGCFSGARDLRAMADRWGKPLVWYIDGCSTSAGVAWAVACDRILIPKEGRTGSIGVIAELRDWSKAQAEMGVGVRLITSGKRKADGNPAIPISDDAAAAIQASVDYEAKCFFDWVSARRGIPAATIQSWEAGIFHGQQAIDVGLADAFADDSSAVAMVAALKKGDLNMPGKKRTQSATALPITLAALRTGLATLALQDSAEGREALALANSAGLDVHALAQVPPGAGASSASAAVDDTDDDGAVDDTDDDGAEDDTDDDGAVDDTDDDGAEDETDEDSAVSAVAASLGQTRVAQAQARVKQLRAQAKALDNQSSAASAEAMACLCNNDAAGGKKALARSNALKAKAVDMRSRATDMAFTAEALALAVKPAGRPARAANTARVFAATAAANAPRAVGKARPVKGAASATAAAVAPIPRDMLEAARLIPRASALTPEADGTMSCGLMTPEEARALNAKIEQQTAAMFAPENVGG